MRSIGGFFPLELRPATFTSSDKSVAQTWFSDEIHLSFSSARAAILSVQMITGSKNLWIPEIYCDVFDNHKDIKIYKLKENSFDPDDNFLEKMVASNEVVVVPDFFGIEPSHYFRDYVKTRGDIHWIQDACQNLSPEKYWGDFTIFSPRKLFGVLDGGILIQNNFEKNFLITEKFKEISPNHQIRIAPIMRKLDKYNLGKDLWYKIYKHEESAVDFQQKKCSKLTIWQLSNMNLTQMGQSRNKNFKKLYSELKSILIPGLVFADKSCAFGFPIYINDRDKFQKRLASEGIYAPVHWRSSRSNKSKRQVIHEAHQLTLPCDHRYGTSHMEKIIDIVFKIRNEK